MSWLSSIGNAFKSVGRVAGSVVKTIGSVAKRAVVPLASFAAGLVPGIGPLLSSGVDALGNSLLGGAGGSAEAVAEQSPSPVNYLVQPTESAGLSLGNSPAAQALATATSSEVSPKNGFLGIGDGKPGVAGIGDGKPGVAGIGTGKNKAKKAAAQSAREYAERVAAVDGLTPNQIKLKGDAAAARAEAEVERNHDKPAAAGDNKSVLYLVLAALGLAIL